MARAGNSFATLALASAILAAFSFLFSGSRAACAQAPQNENAPTPAIKSESNLVIVRVVVRDAHGKPIEGLTKEDFKLRDQGKEQSISQFEAIPSGEALLQPPSASGVPSSGQTQNSSSQRFLALYFDNLNSTEAEIMQAREAADSYLTHNLQPTDRVAIFTAEGMLTDFTSDAQKIHAAMTALRRSPTAAQRVGQCPRISPYQAIEILHTNDTVHDSAWRLALEEANNCIVATSANPETDRILINRVYRLAQEVASSAATQARASLQTLNAITKYIAQAPGQRTIILVSPGFLSESEQNQLDRIIENALRSQIVINSLDPKGLANLMRALDASRHDGAIADVRANIAIQSLDSAQQFVASDVLAELAQGTGGQFIHNDNDLKAGFDSLAGHPAHYVLAFNPKNLKHDGKYHEIKVSLAEKQKGITVQARRGYFASSGQQTATIATPAAPVTFNAAPLPQPAPTPSQQQTQQAQSQSLALSPRKRETPSTKLFTTFKAKKITVEQLVQILATAHDVPDAQLATQLKGLELTERLSTPALVRMSRELPGPASQTALYALGDASAFLALPAAEISTDPAPNASEQKNLLAQATGYVQKALSRLPNFLAMRQSMLFVDKPQMHSSMSFTPGEPLHYVNTTSTNVFYRNGREKIDSYNQDSTQARSSKSRSKDPVAESPAGDIASSGQFGPVLAKVLSDAAQGKLEWGYWQKSEGGNLAVFRYSVPRKNSHYNVQFTSTVYAGFTAYPFKERPGYHGEIAIDPANGTVMRLSVLANLGPDNPMTRADLAVEYGSVELGGQSYICPLRSVVLVRAYSNSSETHHNTTMEGFAEQDSQSDEQARERINGSPQTLLTDVVFHDYHLFRSEAHILHGSTSVPDSNSP